MKTGKELEFGDTDLSRNHRPLQAPIGADGRAVPGTPLSGGLRRNPREAPLLLFVPVTFTVYRPLKPRLRWAMQCLVSFADRAGRCCRRSESSPSSPGCPRVRCPAIWLPWSRLASSPGSDDLAAVTNTRSTAGSFRAPRCPTRKLRLSHNRRDRKQIHLNRQNGRASALDSQIRGELWRDPRRAQQWEARCELAAIPVLVAALGAEADRAGLLRTGIIDSLSGRH